MEDEDRSYVIDDQYQDNGSMLNEPTERDREAMIILVRYTWC